MLEIPRLSRVYPLTLPKRYIYKIFTNDSIAFIVGHGFLLRELVFQFCERMLGLKEELHLNYI